ncbi:phospholipase D-like domain-containing protein [Dechloromonas sp.]|uniref:phospholipase D-like domain-containing protein n=1 Tax=Dechloromonas sp. TaxID=1917218 RepID=UPI00120879CA|nr:phospholipase D-like domain-containing protein [Dechloromonas sp.]MBU3695423.1 hypothetical protein [Dechloromonas sp.]TEX48727.1 MAG: hypothetical protein CFR70_05420 [Rhodocyclaceae bacterium]
MAAQLTEYKNLLLVLAPHSRVGAPICAAITDGRLSGLVNLRQVCTMSGLSQSNSAEVEAFLISAQRLGLVERTSGLTWSLNAPKQLSELAPMLFAIQVYRSEVHTANDKVDVVLTKPSGSSQVAHALDSTLRGDWGLINTRDLLPIMAEQANQRFAIMTPFVDDTGADIIASLFANTRPGVRRELIIRSGPDGGLPVGLARVSEQLNSLGVRCYNFRLDRTDTAGYETFHAKVVLVDAKAAYVGSANMNKWSFEYSLELGLRVTGKAGGRIAEIIDAIIHVSTPVSLECTHP